jgi:multiple sugar transport system permease protein
MLRPLRVSRDAAGQPRARRIIPEHWRYLGPAVLWFLGFAIFPIVYTLNLSFRDWKNPDLPFVGLRHYAEMLTDRNLIESLQATALFAAGTLTLSFVLGLAIALLLSADDLPAKPFFRSMLILPYVISPIVVGLSFKVMLHPVFGVFNYIFGTVGRNWLGSLETAMATVILVTVWELTPFFAIILLAGLLSLPQEPYQAARVDGANSWQLFRYLTLPLLRPVSQVVLLIGVIDVLKAFGIIFALTQGGPGRLTAVVGYYVFEVGFRFFRIDYAAALSVVLIAVVALLAFLTMRALSEQRESA